VSCWSWCRRRSRRCRRLFWTPCITSPPRMISPCISIPSVEYPIRRILSSPRAVPIVDWVMSWFFSRFRAPASPRTPFVPCTYWTSCRFAPCVPRIYWTSCWFAPCVPSGRLPDWRTPHRLFARHPSWLFARHPSWLSCGVLSRWCRRIRCWLWRRMWGRIVGRIVSRIVGRGRSYQD
jgi:hypothetical protein